MRILDPDTVTLMVENQIGEIEAGVLRTAAPALSNTAAPALSNNVDLFPGVTLKWGFGHMINMQASATVTYGRRSQFAAHAPPVGKVDGKLTVVIFGGRRKG